LRGADTHGQLPCGQFKARAHQQLHGIADGNRQTVQRLLPQDRRATIGKVVDIQRTARRRLIQTRGGRAEYRSRAVRQCRAIAIRLVEQRIGRGILEIRHAPANSGSEIREGTQVIIHQHGPRHADAPREGLQ